MKQIATSTDKPIRRRGASRIKVLSLFLLVLLLGLVFDLRGGGQNTVQSEILTQMSNFDSFPSDDQPLSPEEEKRIAARNVDRQKRMVADAEKLLTLATELNDEVKCANTGILTPQQARKVNEMEKLAHSVKEKMSSPVVPTMSAQTPYSAVYR
jgi:hypothetical protein